MKKLYFIAGCAAMLFTGCASEDVIVPQSPQNSGKLEMSFVSKAKNISRSTSLETLHQDFGVWAYKGADETAMLGTENKVMDKYMVAYDTDLSTRPEGKQPSASNNGSDWYYEWYGSADGISTKSNVEHQYLKYWDFSQPKTMFYAYAPYINGTGAPVFTPSTRTLEFKSPVTIGASDDAANNMLYAAKAVAKANYGDDVALEFKRLNSKIKLAFFSDIEGYRVEMLSAYNPVVNTEDAEFVNTYDGAWGTVGWSVLPKTDPTAGYDKTGHLYEARPQVVFNVASTTADADGNYAIDGVVTYPFTADNKHTDIACGWEVAKIGGDGADKDYIGQSFANRTYSPTEYNVIPCADITGETVPGYRLFVSFKLHAIDTNEVITVYNAPVYIPADYCQWSANTIYTYVLKIGRNVGGTTETPTDPDPDPEDPDGEDALYPIIFNNLIVQDYQYTNDADDDDVADVFDVSTGTHTQFKL